jgi:hypothetical protein
MACTVLHIQVSTDKRCITIIYIMNLRRLLLILSMHLMKKGKHVKLSSQGSLKVLIK